MELDDKTKKVFEYAREIQGKEHFKTDRNKMAMAFIFEVKFRKFVRLVEERNQSNIEGTSSNQEEYLKLYYSMIDELIDIYECSSEKWKLFWRNEIKIGGFKNPKKIPFNEIGKESFTYIDLFKCESIKIGMMVRP